MCSWIWNDFFFQPLNVWVGLTSKWTALFWTGLIKPDQRPLTCSGRGQCGEGNLFWMLLSSLFSVRGWTHHAPFTTRSTQTDIVISCDDLDKFAQKFLIHLVWNTFPTPSQIHSTTDLLLPFLRKPVWTCAWETKKQREWDDVCSTNAL